MKLFTLQSGPISRLRNMQKKYIDEVLSNPNAPDCAFCDFKENRTQVLEEYEHFWLVNNIYGYASWDGCKVLDHTMLVPKRHMTTLADMNEQEEREYMKYVKRAEKEGLSVYTRSNGNITKSVPHVHTHFIKTAPARLSFFVYIRKPHVVLFK